MQDAFCLPWLQSGFVSDSCYQEILVLWNLENSFLKFITVYYPVFVALH